MSISALLLEKYGPESLHAVFKAPLKSLVERRIIKASADIRKDHEWTTNLDNEKVRQRWAEIATEEHEATEKDMAYIFAELEYYKALQEACGNKAVQGGVDMVWIKDISDDDALVEEIKRGTDRWGLPARHYLGKVYESKVLLLVDPSVYPLNYNTTRLVLSPIESPAAALHPSTFGTMAGPYDAWSKAIKKLNKRLEADKTFYLAPEKSKVPLYSWLPADIRVEMDGSVSINSYINNLHPVSHAAFYSTLSRVLAKTVPLLEQVLTDIVHLLDQRVIVDNEKCVAFTAYHPEYDRRGDIDMSICPDGDLDDAWDAWESGISYTELAPEVFIEPKRPFSPYTLHSQDLQVVVKMINTYLTPENPKHDTDSWQVLNVDSEKVAAITVY
ncbi:hypothetical protein GGI26_001091 [Coemansia sp. RSA 1358]|nr:hypothetical protein GGI26_001091 [Coemansia sp. RSA 1358]